MQLQGFMLQIESLLISMQILHQLSFHENLQDLHTSLEEVNTMSLCSDVIV